MSQEPNQSAPVPPQPQSDAKPTPSPTRSSSPGRNALVTCVATAFVSNSYWARAKLVLAAWLVSLLAAGCSLGADVPKALSVSPLLILVFPMGLVEILGMHTKNPMPGGFDDPPAFIPACVLYIVLTTALFCLPQGRAFRALFVVLLVLLAMNVVGCYMVKF